MIGIDTNVLVRFLTQDDEAQYQLALQLFLSEDIFIPTSAEGRTAVSVLNEQGCVAQSQVRN